MDFIRYIGKLVHITVSDNFWYKGKVISADKDGVEIIDIKGKRVSLSNKSILTMGELN